MKRKLVTLVMASVIITVTALAGCGNDNGGNTGTVKTTEVTDKRKDTEKTDRPDTENEEEVTLTVGYPTSFVPDAFEVVAEMAKEQMGITIVAQPYSDADETTLRSLLASGEAPDLIFYNSGSLMKRLNPSEYFVDISTYENLMNRMEDTFKSSVTVDKAVYGIPQSASMGGGVLYNKEMYKKYGLKVPKTWDEFLQNCEVLKEAKETAVIGTFGSSWTSQLVFLADYYNITAEEPDFSKEFESGKAKYATTPIAVRSFEKYADIIPYYNEDYAVATYDDGCVILAEGEGCHYFMQTQALSNIYSLYGKDVVDKIGFFAVPGDDADKNGMTVWPPNAVYVSKDSDKIDAAVKFLEFYISDEALDAYSEIQLPTGPYSVVGYASKGEAFKAVEEDMQAYFDEGRTALAQEYETPVKGPGCESICVEVANGQVTGQEAAVKYDKDCYKQAVQLGLDWSE